MNARFPIFTLVAPGFSVETFETAESVARFLAREKMAFHPDSFGAATETAILSAIAASQRRVNVFYPLNSPDFAYRCERHDYFYGELIA